MKEVKYILVKTLDRKRLQEEVKFSTSTISNMLRFKCNGLNARKVRLAAINKYNGKLIEYAI